jgi:hypothetical protein
VKHHITFDLCAFAYEAADSGAFFAIKHNKFLKSSEAIGVAIQTLIVISTYTPTDISAFASMICSHNYPTP